MRRLVVAVVLALCACKPASSDNVPQDAGTPDACMPGLPPSGFATLVEGDTAGANADVVLTVDGAPVVAYTAPKGDRLGVYLMRWDPSCSTWSAPIEVDTSALQNSGTTRQVSLAYDASTGDVGVAYQVITAPLDQDHAYEIRFATLARGASAASTPERVDDPAADATEPHARSAPGLAMANGDVFVGWYQAFRKCGVSGCDAVVYRAKSSGTWSAESVAPTAAEVVASAQGTAVAVDSEGKPAIAFVAGSFDQEPIHGEVDYWRPGDAASSVALGADVGTDDPNVALAFAGTKPRIAAAIHLTDAWATDGKAIWFTASSDGVTWPAAVPIPTDGGALFGSWVALAVDGETKATVLGDVNSGDGTFGNPKIARTTDLTTFALGGPSHDAFAGPSQWLRAALGADGKVNAVFFNPPNSGPVKAGLVFYRE